MSKKYIAIVLILVVLTAITALAQDDTTPTVSDDEVNAIAGKLYCPVCEGIPLDDCGTTTCVAWKEEIRNQIASGMSEQEIIDAFIQRFGQQVVGLPQDPLQRAITLALPWLGVLVTVIIGGRFLMQQMRQPQTEEAALLDTLLQQAPENEEDTYRARFEADLKARR
ncbi:MAG: hypothetical protein D6712_14655 [Chloroflexi bacterium]|nr:MAG: hypothetical protein D6712_14655 [Chloroflexota bacterium]